MILSQPLRELIQQHSASPLLSTQLIQNLWAGYGQLLRLQLANGNTLILKLIHLQAGSGVSHQRKLTSYQVEQQWYAQWAANCPALCRVAACLGMGATPTQRYLLLEDLDQAGFSLRASDLSDEQLHAALTWLAHFHAYFLHAEPSGLWPQGNYWHLATRQAEWQQLNDPRLKHRASEWDLRLQQCDWTTLIHGDAKSDNFCFADAGEAVAMVDFQYVGRGCGIQDVVYLLDSALNSEQCFQRAPALLDYYLGQLQHALGLYHPEVNAQAVAHVWRELYPVAWVDFYRFVLGWAPGQVFLSPYVESMLAEL